MQIHKTALPGELLFEPKVFGEGFIGAEQLAQPLAKKGYGRYLSSLLAETKR